MARGTSPLLTLSWASSFFLSFGPFLMSNFLRIFACITIPLFLQSATVDNHSSHNMLTTYYILSILHTSFSTTQFWGLLQGYVQHRECLVTMYIARITGNWGSVKGIIRHCSLEKLILHDGLDKRFKTGCILICRCAGKTA